MEIELALKELLILEDVLSRSDRMYRQRICDSCGRDWGHGYCGVCQGRGTVSVPSKEAVSLLKRLQAALVTERGKLQQDERLTAPSTKFADMRYAICYYCNHFYDRDDNVHMDDGEQEYDHAPSYGGENTLQRWRELRPDLFIKYADGKIGPNSIHFSREGKYDKRPEAS